MALAEIFDEEEKFENIIRELINTEIKLQSIYPKMEKQAKNKEIKNYFIELQQFSNLQLERLDELCEIYDIVVDSNESYEINSLMFEAEKLSLNDDEVNRIDITDIELVQTIEKIKTEEEQYIHRAIDLAHDLHYEEAVDILNYTTTNKKFNGNFSL